MNFQGNGQIACMNYGERLDTGTETATCLLVQGCVRYRVAARICI